MSRTAMFLAMMCTGLLSLTFAVRAGSDDVFAPLESVELFGSACTAQAHEVGGAAVRFVCAVIDE